MARAYRYDFLDRALMRERRSDDHATAEAIERLGGDPDQPTPDEARPVDVVRDQIDLADSDQVRDGTRALGVTRNALEDAVRAVGPSLAGVRRYLGHIQS